MSQVHRLLPDFPLKETHFYVVQNVDCLEAALVQMSLNRDMYPLGFPRRADAKYFGAQTVEQSALRGVVHIFVPDFFYIEIG